MKKPLALLGLAAACSGGAPQAQPQADGGAPQTSQQQRFPGASGLLAAIDGRTLQVQSESEQTAVTYSSKTAFTQQVATTAAAVTVGSCVMVRDSSAPDPRTTAPPTAAPTAPPAQASAVTAASVQVSAPVSGSCTGGAGGPAGGGPQLAQGSPPPGLTLPSGATPPPGGRAFVGGGGSFGKVVSKTADGFVVSSTRPGQSGTTQVTVTTTGSTTYTAERAASAAALKVGLCVTARGTSDTTGTVAATSIAIRPATNGSCDAIGFRRG